MPKPEIGHFVVTHSGNVYEILDQCPEDLDPNVRKPKTWWRCEMLDKGALDATGPHQPGGVYRIHETSMVQIFSPNEFRVWQLGRAFGK